MKAERWRHIERLYHAAREHDASQRAAFLEEACAGDATVRREVESLLAADRQAGSFLALPALDVAAKTMAADQTESLTGQTVNHYRILQQLGMGGMGEVYLAEDTQLGRKVALKFLPADLVADEHAKKRLLREAQAAAKLDHENICSIYEVGEEDGRTFIVMQYVEGQTLASRIQREPMELKESLDIAVQVADALVEAHSHGIIHRDVKPKNIMLTARNQAKVMDFGLAKAVKERSALESEAETQSLLTEPGAIVGTVPYMSPEQVRGESLDARSDIFSFGAVLYEIVSGHQPFASQSPAATFSSILTRDPPPLARYSRETPPELERIVAKALRKDREERYQTVKDMALDLKELKQRLAKDVGNARLFSNARLWMVATAFFLLVSLALLPFTITHFRQAPAEVRATRLSVLPPEKSTVGTVTVSPDGRRLAFIARDAAGKSLLWVRPLDSLAAQPLAGTDDAIYPFWSPDSRFIGFFAGGKLKKVEVIGGPPNTLCNAAGGRGGAWNPDDVIIFAPDIVSALSRVSASGGEPSPVTTLDPSRQENSHRFPQFLPDGRHFLYFARSPQPENSAIYVGSLGQPQAKRIISANTNVAYAPPGYLLFPREGTLMAQAFDVASLELTGAPFRVAEQVGFFGRNNEAYFSVSDTEVLVYQSRGTVKTQFVWFDRNGQQRGSPGPPGEYLSPALSPDEKRVAFDRVDPQTGTTDIWLLDLTRGISSRFTFDPAQDAIPIWSPDGSRIVFSSNRDGDFNLYQKLSSGAGSEEAILKSGDRRFPSDWSLDGRFILYYQNSPNTQWDLWVLPLFGDRQPIPFIQTKFSELRGVFSPDARWIAYQSNESGSYQVYVQSFPPSGGKWQISSDGGDWPRWRRDGKELFYLTANGRLMAVEVKTNASAFEFSVPKPLFETHTTTGYAVTADGQRFLLDTPVEESASAPITVVLNWAAEVKR